MQTYEQTLALVEHNQGIEWLVTEYRNDAQRMVAKGGCCLVFCLPPFRS